MKKLSNVHKQRYKQSLRRWCESYMTKYDSGENPYLEFCHIRTIVKKLDGQWAEKKLN
jgi:hypothetical protein